MGCKYRIDNKCTNKLVSYEYCPFFDGKFCESYIEIA